MKTEPVEKPRKPNRSSSADERYLLAIDQGTTSTRAIAFDAVGHALAVAQREHDQVFPEPGWVQQDARQIWHNTCRVVGEVVEAMNGRPPAAIGITNQRETTLVWNPETGEPLHDAIVWQDTRSQPLVDRIIERIGVDGLREITGLPVHPYFSATKLLWLFQHVRGLREAAETGHALFGTMDTWVLWNLTGGAHGERTVHATDVTNASRTLLFDALDLDWSDEALAGFDVPRRMLPEVHPSSHVFGSVDAAAAGLPAALDGVPIAGILGDQQAAAFGQTATRPGDAKNTYGTGSFLLVNTGDEPVIDSAAGLLTTIAYQLDGQAPSYALEGSIAVTGSLVQWLRDNLDFFDDAADIEALANEVDDNGGVVIVPAFSGLFAPYWRPDARGVIVGLTRYVTKAHIARAALESIAHQSADVVEASGREISELRVDGGASTNDLLMQMQADLLGVPVQRLTTFETTALGAAYAAGLAVGVWHDLDELRELTELGRRFEPQPDEAIRTRMRAQWADALPRSYGLA